MKKAVLAVLANKNYIDQAKQMFSAAYWKAGWKGDYLLLAHEIDPGDVSWFIEKGIIVHHCQALATSETRKVGVICLSKFYMLTEYFKQWEHVVYLDTDIIIRGSIDGLLNVKGFGACHSLGQTVRDELCNMDKLDKVLRENIEEKYQLDKNAFNAGVLSFSTDIITDNIFTELVDLYKKYVDLALYDDQTIFNLYFNGIYKEMPPVYNRTVEKSHYKKINPDRFEGLLIHTVSLGDGPWNTESIFHDEWKENLEKADEMDLLNVPKIVPWPQKKIEEESMKIFNAHVFGYEKGIVSKIKQFLARGIRLFFTDPTRAFVKIKQLSEFRKKHDG